MASTNISSLGYDPASETLEVEFSAGAIYQYYNVGAALYDRLMTTPSRDNPEAYIKNAYPVFSGRIGPNRTYPLG